jgi:hypothetical protein
MTATTKFHSHHQLHRKRRFRVRPQSLGVGFESFDVADFRAPNKATDHEDLMLEPHPLQYLAGWASFVLWMALVGLLVLNSDLLLSFLWLLLGRHF